MIFLVPFAFILVTAAKTDPGGGQPGLHLADHLAAAGTTSKTVLTVRQFVVLRAFINSTTLTVFSVGDHGGSLGDGRLRAAAAVLALEPAGQLPRAGRPDRPPAVVPTIWVLQEIGLFKQMLGMILVDVAFGLPFCVLLFRAFVCSIPRELDEAAVVDGAGPLRLFFSVILPLLKPVVIT